MIIAIGDARDAGEAVGIDRIHTHGYTVEAGIFQGLRHLREEMPIGGHGNVEGRGVLKIAPSLRAWVGDGFSHAVTARPELRL